MNSPSSWVLDGERAPSPEGRSVRQRLLPGGMVKLELVLEPDEAYLILCAVERAREVSACDSEERERPPQPMAGTERAAETAGGSAETSRPSRADGAVKLAESFLAGNPVSGRGGERFQVMAHLDQEVLGPDGAWAATLEDGTRVSAETFRRVVQNRLVRRQTASISLRPLVPSFSAKSGVRSLTRTRGSHRPP